VPDPLRDHSAAQPAGGDRRHAATLDQAAHGRDRDGAEGCTHGFVDLAEHDVESGGFAGAAARLVGIGSLRSEFLEEFNDVEQRRAPRIGAELVTATGAAH